MCIATGCRLDLKDFRWDEADPKIRINEKGNKRRTIGLHYQAANTIREYVEHVKLIKGPLFCTQLNSNSKKLGKGRFTPTAMYFLLQRYLEQLPGAMVNRKDDDPLNDRNLKRCIYTPHSPRAVSWSVSSLGKRLARHEFSFVEQHLPRQQHRIILELGRRVSCRNDDALDLGRPTSASSFQELMVTPKHHSRFQNEFAAKKRVAETSGLRFNGNSMYWIFT